MSIPSDLNWILDQCGYIPDDDGVLAKEAHRVWNRWWDQWVPPTHAEGLARVHAALARPRPSCPSPVSGHSTRVDGLAWVRVTDHIVTNDSEFPKYNPSDMAQFLAAWTREDALKQLAGATWQLIERPGGWAGVVTTNGNDRSLIALAAGMPLVRVRVGGTSTFGRLPHLLSDPTASSTLPQPPDRMRPARQRPVLDPWSSDTVETLRLLADLGLCAPLDLGRNPEPLVWLDWVTTEFPWLVAETIEDVEARIRDFNAWADLDRHARIARHAL